MTKSDTMSIGLKFISLNFVVDFYYKLTERWPAIRDGTKQILDENLLLILVFAIATWIVSVRVARNGQQPKARSHAESSLYAYFGAMFCVWPLMTVIGVVASGERLTYFERQSPVRSVDAVPFTFYMGVLVVALVMLTISERMRLKS